MDQMQQNRRRPPSLSPLPSSHHLWPEVDRTIKRQVDMAMLSNMGETDNDWELFARDGEMKLYRRHEDIDGTIVSPIKVVHEVKGFTGHEMCYYFFNPQYRYAWETTLEHMTVVETVSDDTIIFHQTHKRVWPSNQRDVVFWSHIRQLPKDKNSDGFSTWIVVNKSTEHPHYPANIGSCVRMYMTVCLLCETEVKTPKKIGPISRNDIICKITYCTVINPGGWVPSGLLRSLHNKEYPKFLNKFTSYVKKQVKGKPVIY